MASASRRRRRGRRSVGGTTLAAVPRVVAVAAMAALVALLAFGCSASMALAFSSPSITGTSTGSASMAHRHPNPLHHPRGPGSHALTSPQLSLFLTLSRRRGGVGVFVGGHCGHGGRAVLGMSSSNSESSSSTEESSSSKKGDEMDEIRRPKIMAATTGVEVDSSTEDVDPSKDSTSADNDSANAAAAATNTINERLMAELERDLERQRSSGGTPSTTSSNKAVQTIGRIFSSGEERTDEERELALQEARDLNGVNPLVAIGSSLFAFAFAVGWWYVTTWLSGQFASHPVSVDAAVPVQRLASVFRNVIVGITTLASGFAGVTGVGLLLLGLRVGYGVYVTGDLDPTPVRTKSMTSGGFDFGDLAGAGGGKDGEGDGDAPKDDGGIELPNAWDLMMGKKKPGSRRRR